MSNSSENVRPSSTEDGLSLVEVATISLRHWRVIAILPVVLALVVIAWTLRQEREYAATAAFMPQGSEARSAGTAAGLARQFGFDLGGDGSQQSPDFYVGLLRSRAVLRQAVEAEYTVPDEVGRVRTATLIDLYRIGHDTADSPPWRRAAQMLRANISTSVARETGIVQITVTAFHPALAEQIAERLLELLNTFNLEVLQSRAEGEARFMGGRIEQAQAELLAAEGVLKEFLTHNRQFPNSPELTFTHDRLQREVAMRQEVYTSLLRAQEQARIDAVRDTRLLVVIDPATGSAEPKARGVRLRAMLAFVLGLMISLIVAFATEMVRRARASGDRRYGELRALVGEVWYDVRNPTRWLRSGQE